MAALENAMPAPEDGRPRQPEVPPRGGDDVSHSPQPRSGFSLDEGLTPGGERTQPSPGSRWPVLYTRRLIMFEVGAVLAVSLGRSAVSAFIDLMGSLTARKALSAQHATLNASAAPGRPWLDLSFQLYGIAFGLAPVLLVAYLLSREGASLRTLGADRTRPWWDLGRGAAVAAVIGGSGLGLYLAAHAAGAALTVVPTTLPPVWWRIPVLIASAFQNAALEEVVVLGYLLRRFKQAGLTDSGSDVLSALIRGSYHLYQGFGGFIGNLVMGLIFARLYRRWGRVMPLLVAHGLIDTVAFVGYVLLAPHVSWLPH
ncbi:MAG TPA: CPBP family intramembrane glutamic endopeptidase [Actinocrinis sp.]|nr:CPBP family intramembrane glutamic endopeptidase [Actinocrinis sp.]HXR73480.1 CPBP family intramembrane glutamic endopeptidase [Actinocrinis sp.]